MCLKSKLNARTSKRKVWINELESDAFALLSAARENAIDDREGHIAKMDVMMVGIVTGYCYYA